MKKLILGLGLLILSCSTQKLESTKMVIDLNENWQFKQSDSDAWLTATVPGQVHLDLMNHDIIDDPFYRTNEQDIQWVGEKDWEYQTTFMVDSVLLANDQIDMVFNGLDTYARVTLNGKEILKADNMFRTWRVDCKPYLKSGENSLHIYFRSVFKENLPKWADAPFRLMAFDNNDQAEIKINMYSRKAGYHFGWDWGPRLITASVWRPIHIEAWNEAKLGDLYIQQNNVTKEKADITAVYEITSEQEQTAAVLLTADGKTLVNKTVNLKKGVQEFKYDLSINNPKLWWSNGLGEPYLYDFKGTIITESNKQDSKSEKIGLRSMRVIAEPDEHGKSLYVELNGVPVFAKGANYIPQDNFVCRLTDADYEQTVLNAKNANMNMLRVWGGGLYENDIFYELCDKHGIMVWQDFMFACAMYPGDENFLQNVEQEVFDNVKRLRNHASIALWCGNNENNIGWHTWGWKEQYSKKEQKIYEQDMYNLFSELIPTAMDRMDSATYYQPSSPMAGFEGNGLDTGDAHYWDVWHGKVPFTEFENPQNIARFMSEYGFQSYPDFISTQKFTIEKDWDVHSPVMQSHQRCMSDARKDKEYGNRLIKAYMDRNYNEPKDFQAYLYTAQVLQAKGIKMAIEAHRRAMPYCMGTLYWQINDCWPVASWSSVDYYGRWKALHYATKKAYNKFLVSIDELDGMLKIYAVSDKHEDVPATLTLELANFSGDIIFSKELKINIKANKSEQIIEFEIEKLLHNQDPTTVLFYAKLVNDKELLSENVFYFVPPKDLMLETPTITHEITDNKITLTSDKLAKDVYLVDDGSGFFSDNYFDILPGKPITITYRNNNDFDLATDLSIMSLIDSY